MEQLLIDWGYIILFLYSLGGGMAALVVASVMASFGKFSILFVIIVAFISNFIGDNILFYLAKDNKSYVYNILKKYRKQLAYSRLIVKKYGLVSIFIQKYIYGVKTLVPIIIGFSGFEYKKFIIINLFASIIWAIVVGLISYYLGDILIK